VQLDSVAATEHHKKGKQKASSYNEIIETKNKYKKRQPKEPEVEGKRSRHLLLAKL